MRRNYSEVSFLFLKKKKPWKELEKKLTLFYLLYFYIKAGKDLTLCKGHFYTSGNLEQDLNVLVFKL